LSSGKTQAEIEEARNKFYGIENANEQPAMEEFEKYNSMGSRGRQTRNGLLKNDSKAYSSVGSRGGKYSSNGIYSQMGLV
jgi:general stress protein YciG